MNGKFRWTADPYLPKFQVTMLLWPLPLSGDFWLREAENEKGPGHWHFIFHQLLLVRLHLGPRFLQKSIAWIDSTIHSCQTQNKRPLSFNRPLFPLLLLHTPREISLLPLLRIVIAPVCNLLKGSICLSGSYGHKDRGSPINKMRIIIPLHFPKPVKILLDHVKAFSLRTKSISVSPLMEALLESQQPITGYRLFPLPTVYGAGRGPFEFQKPFLPLVGMETGRETPPCIPFHLVKMSNGIPSQRAQDLVGYRSPGLPRATTSRLLRRRTDRSYRAKIPLLLFLQKTRQVCHSIRSCLTTLHYNRVFTK